MIPFQYTQKLSREVCKKTIEYIRESSLEKEIENLGWIYQSVGDLIPHTTESFWSGHFFPWTESYEELQISWNLCSMGFYKQAMTSLRSTFRRPDLWDFNLIPISVSAANQFPEIGYE